VVLLVLMIRPEILNFVALMRLLLTKRNKKFFLIAPEKIKSEADSGRTLMQLIWMSGPTSRVVTLSLTRARVLAAIAVMAGFFVLLGGVFQLVGLRVAIAHAPSLAQTMGGIATASEYERVQTHYSTQLAQLRQQLNQTVDHLHQLEAGRQAFFLRVGLGALTQPVAPLPGKLGGRGGPFMSLLRFHSEPEPLATLMDEALQDFSSVQRSVALLHERSTQQQKRLESLPLGMPIETSFSLSSGFGVRSDPMTHLPAMHEGIDFVAPTGTPIVATAPGCVVQAQYNGAYGHMVEVVHAEGFATRYAHLQSIHVQAGQMLRAGGRLGLLGNTGRSSGPHLHYEVLYRGQAMHPVQAVQRWSRS